MTHFIHRFDAAKLEGHLFVSEIVGSNIIQRLTYGIDPADPIHPTNVGKRIVDEYGRSIALDGLKQAVNDIVEEMSDQPLEYIRTEREYYIIAGVLADFSPIASDEERPILSQLVAEYEQGAKPLAQPDPQRQDAKGPD